MKRFRIAVDASVCFDVIASSEDEAIARAKEICEEFCDGADVVADDALVMRVYPDDKAEGLEVHDATELTPQGE